jgi:hypothetical protein
MPAAGAFSEGCATAFVSDTFGVLLLVEGMPVSFWQPARTKIPAAANMGTIFFMSLLIVGLDRDVVFNIRHTRDILGDVLGL